MLALARAAVDAAVLGRRAPSVPELAVLRGPGGAFVTLTEGGRLRGCVGLIESDRPRGEVVVAMARAAAQDDPRFRPVAGDELPTLSVAVSLLGPGLSCSPDEIEVGRDGLIIEHAGARGLLLPEVAVDHGMDRRAFLEAVYHKAGLPADGWRVPGVLRRFETTRLP